MKHLSAFLFLFLALAAHGQNFSPFRPGGLAQYSTAAGDTVRMIQLRRSGSDADYPYDSTYYFESRVKSITSPGQGCGGYSRYNEGPFGRFMGINRPGTMKVEYWLVGNYDSQYNYYETELLLKPRAPLNQNWTATFYETARVVARTVQPVLGVPDSVVTIAFSGGTQLRLSKNHGLVDGPTLTYFFTAGAVRLMTLTALPSQRLGQPLIGALAYYDYQPGDRLVYRFEQVSFPGNPALPPNQNYLFSDSILARTNSRTGDTVTYRVATYSQQSGRTTVNSQVYTTSSAPGTRASQYYVRAANYTLRSGTLLLDAVPSGAYTSARLVQRTLQLGFCGSMPADSAYLLSPNIDYYAGADFAAGLGQVRDYIADHFGTSTSTTLVGYRKGIETWGTLPRMSFGPLATNSARPATTTAAFPSPFGAVLTVSFDLARPQPVTLALHDALGRIVLQQAAEVQPAGSRQLTLTTASLPAGLYTLHLRFGQDGHTEVLKVVKAQ
jgi:hypothetical protein